MKLKELIPVLQKENLYQKRLLVNRTRVYRITTGTVFWSGKPAQESAFFYDRFDMKEIPGWSSDPYDIDVNLDVQFCSDYQAKVGRHFLEIKHKNGKPYNLFVDFD